MKIADFFERGDLIVFRKLLGSLGFVNPFFMTESSSFHLVYRIFEAIRGKRIVRSLSKFTFWFSHYSVVHEFLALILKLGLQGMFLVGACGGLCGG